jgi:hypothetical protein
LDQKLLIDPGIYTLNVLLDGDVNSGNPFFGTAISSGVLSVDATISSAVPEARWLSSTVLLLGGICWALSRKHRAVRR